MWLNNVHLHFLTLLHVLSSLMQSNWARKFLVNDPCLLNLIQGAFWGEGRGLDLIRLFFLRRLRSCCFLLFVGRHHFLDLCDGLSWVESLWRRVSNRPWEYWTWHYKLSNSHCSLCYTVNGTQMFLPHLLYCIVFFLHFICHSFLF